MAIGVKFTGWTGLSGLILVFGAGYWVHDIGPPAGLKHMFCFYRGFTDAATDVPVSWGLFLWLRIRIYWIGGIIRIDFGVWCGLLGA